MLLFVYPAFPAFSYAAVRTAVDVFFPPLFLLWIPCYGCKVSDVGVFPIAVEFSSPTGVSNVPGVPAFFGFPAVVGFPAVDVFPAVAGVPAC